MLTTENKEFLCNLALIREQKQKWSLVVSSGFCSKDSIDHNLKYNNLHYLTYGVKPRFEKLGVNHFKDYSRNFSLDIASVISKIYGVNIIKAYHYADMLGLTNYLPLAIKDDDLGRNESEYVLSGGNCDNDCSVVSMAGLLSISYDESLRSISSTISQNPASDGIDKGDLEVICKANNLSHIRTCDNVGVITLQYITAYELYAMIPELAKEHLAIVVYRHMFYVDKGIVLDCYNYMHKAIYSIICLADRKDEIIRLISSKFSISPTVCDVADERWLKGTTWNTISFDLRIDPKTVRRIAETRPYLAYTEKLMREGRSAKEFILWVSRYKNMISRFSRRMGISKGDAENTIRSVQRYHGIDNLQIW